MATWCEEPTRWNRPCCWERLKEWGEGGDRGWEGWMASLTQWTWVWASSGKWWRTGRPGALQSMGPQGVGRTWVSEQEQKPRWSSTEDIRGIPSLGFSCIRSYSKRVEFRRGLLLDYEAVAILTGPERLRVAWMLDRAHRGSECGSLLRASTSDSWKRIVWLVVKELDYLEQISYLPLFPLSP